MNYFTSCIHGQFDKYQQIKECLHPGDHLWIVGDLLDGDIENPEGSTSVMADIMENNEQITLILGDHEYARCMQYSASGDETSAKIWEDFASGLDISGTPLNEYMAENFTQDDYYEYIGSFLLNCELTAVIPIGGRYFYLCHGAPEHYSEEISLEWQLRVCTHMPEFDKSFFSSVKTDEFSEKYLNAKIPMTDKNTIVISGQLSAATAAAQLSIPDTGKGFAYSDHILAIGRDSIEEPINVIGIDAAGFFLQGRY